MYGDSSSLIPTLFNFLVGRIVAIGTLTALVPDVAPSLPGPTEVRKGEITKLKSALMKGIRIISDSGSSSRDLVQRTRTSSGLLTLILSTKPCRGVFGQGRAKVWRVSIPTDLIWNQ